MNFRIVTTIAGLVWLSATLAPAQSFVEEALIVSRTFIGGTARMQALGGAQIALGGDLSSAYSNPAGLGMYNRSEFSLTPGYATHSIQSNYLGNSSSESKTNLMIPHLGVAFHSSQDGRKGIWGGTLALTFHRVNNFNDTFSYSATNPDNSIIDYFIQDANGSDVSQFSSSGFQYNRPTGLAFYNYLIGPQSILVPPGPDDQYFTDVTGVPEQSETVKNTGAQNQWNLAYALNINDKVFIGATLGIAKLSYKSEKVYTERFTGAGEPMSQLQLTESLSLDGTGINGTLGVIVRPFTPLQLGFSVVTPTGMDIDDVYSANMTTSWNSFEYEPGNILTDEEASTDNVTSDYTISTPWKTSFGLAYFFEKHGFITADAEWINYSKTRYSGDDDWSVDNNEISELYKSVINLRFGGEYRRDKFRFRVGYNYMPDPFKTPQNGVNREIISWSGGVGYRVSKFYVDLSVIHGSGDNSYRPYQLGYPLDPLALQTRKFTTVLVTFGIPFGLD
jgi:hypothetical protein